MLNNNQLAGVTALFFGVVVLWSGLIVGWTANIYWLFATAEDINVEFWIALIGTIVAPVGAIHGWVTIF